MRALDDQRYDVGKRCVGSHDGEIGYEDIGHLFSLPDGPGSAFERHQSAEQVLAGDHEYPLDVVLLHEVQGHPRPCGALGNRFGTAHHVACREHPGQVHIGDELLDVGVLGVRQDLLRRPDLHDRAVFHQGDTIAEFQGLIQIVSHEDDGLTEPLLEVQQFVLHLPADERVKSAECLVHKEYVRVARECPGKPDPLLHAPGELARHACPVAAEPHHIEHIFRLPEALICRDALDLKPEGNVVEHRPVREECKALEDHAQPAPPGLPQLIPAHPDNILAAYPYLAVCRLDEPVDAAQDRRFSAPGESHKDEYLTGQDVEGYVAEGQCRAGLFVYLPFGAAGSMEFERFCSVRAEHLCQAPDADDRRDGSCAVYGCLLKNDGIPPHSGFRSNLFYNFAFLKIHDAYANFGFSGIMPCF
ncbi:hypothetical protein DSECCO2_652670 [anaerobic digester metagenome]